MQGTNLLVASAALVRLRCQELTNMFNFEPMAQVFFTNSGSEANDTQVSRLATSCRLNIGPLVLP